MTIERLLEPSHEPYTEAAALARVRDLLELYGQADQDAGLAAALAQLVASSFWAWLALVAWTKDEKAPALRIKPFSPLACYKTLADWADERAPDGTWLRPLIAIDKSRQLMMSWWTVQRLYWFCHARPFTYCPILSKGQDDSGKLMERVDVIHHHLPAWLWRARDLAGVKVQAETCRFPNGSEIEAMPQKGGDAVRSRVPSMWLADEAAFQSDFESNFTAIKGTSDSRTQGFMVTTASPSFFQKLIEDSQDGRRNAERTIVHASTGLTLWHNGGNRVDCARIHYTADPARRSAAWKLQAQQGMSIYQWRQEFEIDYASRGGDPVFKMLERSVHMMAGRCEVLPLGGGRWGLRVQGLNDPNTGAPLVRPVRLLRAIDHGTRNFCAAVWVAVDDEFDWTVYRIYQRKGWFAPENGRAIMMLSGEWEPGDTPERYAVNVIDAMQGLPDQDGKVEDIYKAIQTPDGRRPMASLETVRKGAGSRQEGIDAIAGMLHSTLAAYAPDHPYWALDGYSTEPGMVESFTEESQLLLALGTELLFEELDAARYDERPGGDAGLNQPETTLDTQDDLTDCLRYLLRSGASMRRKRRAIAPKVIDVGRVPARAGR